MTIRKGLYAGVPLMVLLICGFWVKKGPENVTAQSGLYSSTGASSSFSGANQHWAEVWLQISFSPAPGMIETEMDSTPFDLFVNTQISLMKSPMILKSVVENPVITRLPTIQKLTDPIQWIASRLKVENLGGRQSEIFTVSMSSTDPQEAEMIVNAVVDSYISYYQIDLIQREQALYKTYTEAKARHEATVKKLKDQLPNEPSPEQTQTPDFALLIASVEQEVRMIEDMNERIARLGLTQGSISRVRILQKASSPQQTTASQPLPPANNRRF